MCYNKVTIKGENKQKKELKSYDGMGKTEGGTRVRRKR